MEDETHVDDRVGDEGAFGSSVGKENDVVAVDGTAAVAIPSGVG